MLWSCTYRGYRYELHPSGCGIDPDSGEWILALRGWHYADARGGATVRYSPRELRAWDVTPLVGSMTQLPMVVLVDLNAWLDERVAAMEAA